MKINLSFAGGLLQGFALGVLIGEVFIREPLPHPVTVLVFLGLSFVGYLMVAFDDGRS